MVDNVLKRILFDIGKAKSLSYVIINFLLVVVLGILPYFFMTLLTDVINLAFQKDKLAIIYLSVYLGLGFIVILITLLKTYFSECFKIKIETYINNKIVFKLNKIDYSVVENVSFKEILDGSLKTNTYINDMYNNSLLFLMSLISFISYLFYLATLNSKILAVIILSTIIMLCLNFVLAKKTNNLWPKFIKNMRLSNLLTNIFIDKKYIKERKIYKYDEFMLTKYNNAYDSGSKNNQKIGRSRFKLELMQELLAILCMLVIFLILLLNLKDNNINIGSFTTTFLNINNIFVTSIELGSSLFLIIGSYYKMKSFYVLMDSKVEKDGKLEILNINKIEFKNVSFKYPNTDKYILKNFNYVFDMNTVYGLVGENGSGKSTLVKLLLRIYETSEGIILINENNIKNYNISSLRKAFGVVFQNSYKYAMPLNQLIDVNSPKYNELVKKLELEDLINKLPYGLDTEISSSSEKGRNVSGGQYQKIAILRAFLQENTLILDEPNASLDPISEAKMYDLFNDMLKSTKRMAILITHRLGSLKNVGKILVLKDGKIESTGTHKELMTSSSYYNNLFNSQRELYEN